MTANTSDPFHIVYKPDDWDDHNSDDSDSKRRALDYLAKTTPRVELRDLDAAAQRFQPSNELRNAINAALAARAPLLLTGEPGSGKTQVAWFLKRFFGIELFEYQVRSNSQASDLRYDFDAVAYLHDAYVERHNTANANAEQQGSANDPRSNSKYLKPGPLWQVYSQEDEKILLIDEIDKASRDFPNDILQELDQHRFAHPFHPKQFIERKGAPPIIIITSNGERRLPDAFLRRCVVHHITLDDQLLQDIMQAWGIQFPNLSVSTRKIALQRFQDIRSNNRLSKKPGAAELLLWLTVLSAKQVKAEELNEEIALKDLPELVCLIKDHADYGLLG